VNVDYEKAYADWEKWVLEYIENIKSKRDDI